MRQAYHPLNPEFVGAHAEIRTPGSVGYGHRDPATCAERGEHAIGLSLVVCDDGDVKVVAECDRWTEAFDRIACHEVHGLGDWELSVHDLGLYGVGYVGHERRIAERLDHSSLCPEYGLVKLKRLASRARKVYVDMN